MAVRMCLPIVIQPERDGEWLCHLCGTRIGAGESTGMIEGKVVHLHCWLERSEEAPRSTKPN